MIIEYKTENQIVEHLINHGLQGYDRTYIKNLPEEKVDSLYTTYGMHIRNVYHLWDKEHPITSQHVPKLIDGVDYSDFHPDATSARIIEKVWCQLQTMDFNAWD